MKKTSIAVAAVLLTLAAGNAFGFYRTSVMPVQVTMVPAVTFNSVQTLNFGTVVSGQTVDVAADIVFIATNTLAAYVQLDGGLYHTSKGRFMRDATGLNNVAYSIWSDQDHTLPWGDDNITIPGKGFNFIGTGLIQPITVYGRLVADISTPEGDYTDNVVITVNY